MNLRHFRIALPLMILLAFTAAAADPPDTDDPKPLWQLPIANSPASRDLCAFSPDGSRVACITGGTALVLDAATGKPVTPPLNHRAAVAAVAFSPDGKRIATAGGGHCARLWDAATGRELPPALAHDGDVNAVAFSADGRRVVTAGEDRRAALWDAHDHRRVGVMPADWPVTSVAFSRDGTTVLAAGRDQQACLFDIATGRPRVDPLGDAVACAALSPDGSRVAVGERHGLDPVVSLYDAANGRLLARTPRQWGSIFSVEFSPDGTRVVATTDGSARAWDAATAKPAGPELDGRASMMHRARFSPDGRRVLVVGEAGIAVVWDAATGRPVTWAHGCDAYLDCAFSPDGTRFVVIGGTFTPKGLAESVSVWPASAAAPK